MAMYHCPNLTIVEEQEIMMNESGRLGLSIIIRLPPGMNTFPSHELIQQAIQKQSSILIPLDKFSHFRNDLVAITNSVSEATAVLYNPTLRIDSTNLIMMPCAVDYDAITLPIDPSLPDTTDVIPRVLHSDPKQHTLIRVEGVPPQLCSTSIVQRLFTNICVLTNIEFTGCDSSFSAKTYASKSAIPSTAFIGTRIRANSGTVLYIWPLWYSVTEIPRDPTARRLDQHANDPQRMLGPVRYTLFYGQSVSVDANRAQATLRSTNLDETGIKITSVTPAKRSRISEEPSNSLAEENATTPTSN